MAEAFLQVRLEATDKLSGQYTLSFDSSQYPVTLKPEANISFSEWLRRLRPVLSGGRDPAGDIDPQDLLRNVGAWLWQALLPESAPIQEREALEQALRTGNTPLLLELPDILADFPWELLYDPEQSGEKGFLAYHRPLMRFSASEAVVVPISPPLRVLLLISSPPALGEDSRVDVESERAAVEQATYGMRESGSLHLVVEDIVTPKRVERLLDGFKPHIVHYIGHGEYYQTTGGMLLWEDDQGNTLPLSASHIASLLRSRSLHAVVLHGCETARGNTQAEVISLASTLAQEGFPAILAQQASFTYESSPLASHAWYKALVAGQSMASALLAARQALIKAGRPDWAVPVLQGSIASLAPVLAPPSLPSIADPHLTRVGAAADLPTPTDVFVGRHRELRALHLMLEDMSDSAPVLALITGLGGMGKSTLVAQAVTRYGGAYQAALMLRCQRYQSIDLFLQSIGVFLKRLGAPLFLEHTLPDPKWSTEAKIDEAVVALNIAGPVLLVIDNLESVQDEDQLISDKDLLYLLQTLLTNLRDGRVLVTSRSMMKELVLPENVGTRFLHLSLEDLSRYETSQLLLRYPSLAKLSHVVRQILLGEFGGLPYVYHLLSSKAAVEDLEQIIYEVRDYGTVKQKMITKERKQRTAEEWQQVHSGVMEFAALEVIISRLSEASRTLLAQLGILHQPFPLAAIEEGLGVARTVWQPLLDWSLLHYDQQEQAYRLHSLARRYAEGLLEEQPRKQVQAQLATWYQHYAVRDSHNLTDYLEAHRLLRAAGHVQKAGQLVMEQAGTLMRFGLYQLLYDLCTKTLNDIRESDEGLKAGSLQALGELAYLQGQFEEARGFYRQSLEIAERLGNQGEQAGILYGFGNLALSQGMYENAQDLYQQSMTIAEWQGNQGGQATALHALANLAYLQGQYEEARVLYQQSLAIFEQLRNQQGRAGTLGQLGVIAEEQEQYEEARSFHQQSLDVCEQQGDQNGRAVALQHLGMAAAGQGQYEEARVLYQQSLAIFEQLGNQQGRATTLRLLGNLSYLQREYEEARDLYQRSLGIFERLGDQSGLAKTLYQLGMIAQEQGRNEEARDLYQRSLGIFERLGDQSGLAKTLYQLGVIAQEQGRNEEARDLYQRSLDIKDQLGDQSGLAKTLYQLGMIAQEQGRNEEARDLYQRSLGIFERLGDQSGLAKTLYLLGMIAQEQGRNEEARGLYQRSLDISGRLGDQNGRATALHLLGALDYKEESFENALVYMIQAYILFDALGSPNRVFAQDMITKIHEHMNEVTFTAQWRTIAGDHPLPSFSAEDRQQLLLQVIINFMSTPTWETSKRFLESHPELLQPEIDGLLQDLATQQGHEDDTYKMVEDHRLLLAQCREKGIDITFAEIQIAQNPKVTFTADLRRLCNEVVAALRTGNTEQREVLAIRIERILQNSLSMDVQNFLAVLLAWLREQDIRLLVEKLQSPFRETYTRMVTLMEPKKASTLQQLGRVAQAQGKYEEAQSLYRQSLNIFERLGNQDERARILHQLGNLAQEQGRNEEARDLYQRSLDIFEQLGDQDGRARILHQLGRVAQDLAEYEKARDLYQRSLDIFEQRGDQSRRANTIYQLGRVAQDLAEYEKARSFYQRSLGIFERLGDQNGRAWTLYYLGRIAQDLAEYEEARDLYQRSLGIFERLGDQNGRANSLLELGNLAYLQGEYEEARGLYQQSLDISEYLGDEGTQAGSLGQLGLLAYEQGDFEKALIYMIKAFILFDTLRSPYRTETQSMIARIRSHIDEDTFMTYWRTFAGDRPLVTVAEQEETAETDEDDTLAVEELLAAVSSIIQQGTVEQRQQFAANLVEAQQQLPVDQTPLGRFVGCLVAVLREETPEVAQLVPPFSELWQIFQEHFRISPNGSSQQKEGKDD